MSTKVITDIIVVKNVHDFYKRLPVPSAKSLILAGDLSPKWLPYRGGPSDGIISVEETRLEGVPHRVFPENHLFLMNHPHLVQSILAFQVQSRFINDRKKISYLNPSRISFTERRDVICSPAIKGDVVRDFRKCEGFSQIVCSRSGGLDTRVIILA